jgi:PAS domain S-box-containing protein
MSTKPTYEELEKRLEQLTEKQDENLNQLLKNSFDMIVMLDANGMQLYVSESCEKILGFRPEELTNIPVIDKMIHHDDREKVVLGFRSIVAENKHGGTQYRHRHKNGEWVYLEAYGNNQLDNPHIKAVVLNVRDVTERNQAVEKIKENEMRLNRLNAMKDRLFSIIGHDLRTPFSNIVGLSEILLEEIQNKNFEESKKLAVHIHDSSERALLLLNNLLEWARMQTGHISFQPETLNLQEIISETIQLFEDFADQKSIRIDVDIPDNQKVKADKKMVGTVLRNLISNSIKFNYPNGSLTIRAQKKRSDVVVSVTDEGVGMHDSELNNLFCSDQNHSTQGTNNESGTGLGLLLCKEFTEMHDGKIWAESEPGKGSTFYFTLPAAQ